MLAARGVAAWLPETEPGLDGYDVAGTWWEQRHAIIYRARRRIDGTSVLVKLPSQPEYTDQLGDWFQRDYQIARSLRAEAVVKPLALERTRLGPALVLADEDARPLEEIAAKWPLDIEAVLTIGSCISEAIASVHMERVVHANLNPATIWFDASANNARISDFGCAQHPFEGIAAPLAAVQNIIDLRYMSPEQSGRVQKRMDQRADIYAIGIILFRLLTGKVPFDGADPLSIVDGHLTRSPLIPEFLGAETAGLVGVISKALAKAPESRYLSASGLLADLLECRSRWRSFGAIEHFEPGRHDAKAVLSVPRRLYGRDQTTATLFDIASKVRQGRPAMLLVSGAPGVGKSAFLSQLEEFTRNHKGRFVSGKFDQYNRNIPYFSLVQAIQQLIGQLLSESTEQVEAWRSRILSALGRNVGVVVEVIPELESVIGRQPPVPSLPPAETRNRFNRVFKRFLHTFAEHEQFLCVVMDDLQWVDQASLGLVAHILTAPETRNVLFAGAYRSNEVAADHPLASTARALERFKVDVHTLHLNDLEASAVLQLVQDAFEVSPAEAGELAEILCSKTGGNALYATQLIHFLCDRGIIGFDYCAGKWTWDLPRIHREGITENVLDLLKVRLTALDQDTRSTLATAACVGNSFEIGKVATGAGRSWSEVLGFIDIGVDAGLILALDDGHAAARLAQAPADRRTARFQFVHDRVQQAAFDLVADEAKKEFRLAIGRRLLAAMSPEDELVPQLEALNNLNYAWELLADAGERQRTARLNLAAGRRARQTLAYQGALECITVGLNLLGGEAWQACYGLAFELHSEALECEYLTGNFRRAEQLFAVLLAKAQSKPEKARVYLTKILLDTSEERYEQAIECGVEALQLLGVSYLRNPSRLQLAIELVLARMRMRGRKPQDLGDEAGIEDAEKIAALRILVALFPTAYFLSPNLLMYTGLKVVNLSLRHGISPLSAAGFVLYGLGLGAAMDDHERGYELGRFAVELAEKGNSASITCKVLVIFAGFIKLWRDPISECLPLIERARKLALEAGDHQYVNYAIISGISQRFSAGRSLNEVLRQCDEHEPCVRQSKDAFPVEALTMWRNCALALQRKTEAFHSLDHGLYNETECEARYRRTGNITLLSYQYSLRLQLACLFGRVDEALRLSEKGETVIRSAPGYITVADHYLYRGLAAAMALARDDPRRGVHRRTLRRCRARLHVFAASSPRNFRQHEALLDAEACWAAHGRLADALTHYNSAIEAAEAQGFINLVALANERAALCCLSSEHRRLAAWYLGCARGAYEAWGAAAKVAWLDREYAALLPRAASTSREASDTRAPRPSSTRPHDLALDVSTALQASRIIESGQDPKRVLTQLMQVLRVQAGAEKAHLLVLESGHLRLEASAAAEAGNVVLLRSAPTDTGQRSFSPAIVNYVIHTGDELVLADACGDARFAQCSYLLERRPKSVFCGPLRHQGAFLGVLYLEHQKIAGAFNEQNLDLLRILATEVELTIWSGRLGRYRDYVHKFTPAEVAKQIDANPYNPDLAVKDCDVSILFADLAGYTRMAELMERRQLDELVNRAFSRFLEEIQLYQGTLLGIRGDELFVMFSDEDPSRHAWKAASAANAIARAASRLNEELVGAPVPIVVNMGMNSGLAAVGLKSVEGASWSRWRYGASGQMVNIAARVRELAKDGSILMSGESAARVRNEFVLHEMGEHNLKNVIKPVRIYRLIKARS